LLGRFSTRLCATRRPGYYYDVNNTDVSVQRIHHAASLQQPFLVAHGFIKPQ